MSIDPIFQQLAKPFDKSGYKEVRIGRGFTTIDAYHIVERLTEVFGMCGSGWGIEVEEWRETESNVAAIGHLWYRTSPEAEICRVSAVGDAQILKGNRAEGMKKAMTNLMSKGASYIGVGLSVYQGKGIDDPYLDREYEARVTGTARAPEGTATKRDWETIQQACAEAGVSKDDLRAILDTSPFSCAGRPTALLAIHVPALLSRLAKRATDTPAPPPTSHSTDNAEALLAK